MKVKEIDRTANIAWSPAALHPIYMVAGTAAQQLDATFRYGKDFLLFERLGVDQNKVAYSLHRTFK